MMLRTKRSQPLLVLTAAVSALIAAACGRSDPGPQAPSTRPSTTPVSVSGTERVTWDQDAYSAEELARYRFIGYVDDVPASLTDASCSTTPAGGKFPCSARLPPMSAGRHRLEIAAEEIDGRQRRGPKSGALLLDVRRADTTDK
jgi:hypothetical protein